MENLKVNTIVKEKFKDEFTRMHNQIARNPLLSLKAKGLLLTIMSLPDDWVLHISQLPDFCKESKTSVRSAFNELKENGFIISVEMRDGKGRFKGNNYIAYYQSQTDKRFMIGSSENPANTKSHPHTENPHADNPHTDFPHTDNVPLQRKRVTKKDVVTKKKEKKKYSTSNTEENFSFFSLPVAMAIVQNGGVVNKSQIDNDTYTALYNLFGCDESGSIKALRE